MNSCCWWRFANLHLLLTPQVLQEQLEAADVALQDSQQLRMDYDRMCQQAYELSRKLSQAESARGELQRQLADARCAAMRLNQLEIENIWLASYALECKQPLVACGLNTCVCSAV
jgi:hypothetical protein